MRAAGRRIFFSGRNQRKNTLRPNDFAVASACRPHHSRRLYVYGRLQEDDPEERRTAREFTFRGLKDYMSSNSSGFEDENTVRIYKILVLICHTYFLLGV